MFGLEGSGFTISIAVTLLLCGVIVFYCKQHVNQLEKKIESMLNLNKALAGSLSSLEQKVYSDTLYPFVDASQKNNVGGLNPQCVDDNNETDTREIVSDDSDDSDDDDNSHDSDDDSDSDDESNVNKDNLDEILSEPIPIGSELSDNRDGIKLVELNNDTTKVTNSDFKEISVNLSESVQNVNADDDDSESDDDNDDDDDDDNDDDDDDDNDDNDKEDIEHIIEELVDSLDDTDYVDLSLNELNLDTIKHITTQDTASVDDFNKLKVDKLRNIVVTRNLTDKSSAKKMKKAELIQLLS